MPDLPCISGGVPGICCDSGLPRTMPEITGCCAGTLPSTVNVTVSGVSVCDYQLYTFAGIETRPGAKHYELMNDTFPVPVTGPCLSGFECFQRGPLYINVRVNWFAPVRIRPAFNDKALAVLRHLPFWDGDFYGPANPDPSWPPTDEESQTQQWVELRVSVTASTSNQVCGFGGEYEFASINAVDFLPSGLNSLPTCTPAPNFWYLESNVEGTAFGDNSALSCIFCSDSRIGEFSPNWPSVDCGSGAVSRTEGCQVRLRSSFSDPPVLENCYNSYVKPSITLGY